MLTYSQYYKLVDQALDLFENNIKEARQFTAQQYQIAVDRESQPAQPEAEQMQMPLDDMIKETNDESSSEK